MMPPHIEALLQAWITVSACAAIWLLTLDSPAMRWGFVIGMLGQPAWILSSWVHGQYGMLVVSVFFTIAYGKGIWTHWIKPWRRYRQPHQPHRKSASSASVRAG